MRTNKIEVVLRVLKHPSILPNLVESTGLSAEDLDLSHAIVDPRLYFIMPNEDSVFIFIPKNSITYEIHVAILRKARRMARINFIRVLDWMFSNTGMTKLIASIPTCNNLAILSAGSNGMKHEGVSTKSYKFNDEVYDMHNFGLTKDEFMEALLCQQ